MDNEGETEVETETKNAAAAADLDRAPDGNWEQQYEDDDIVGALEQAFPEPLGATEVAEAAGCVRTTAHNRLEELVEDGVVKTKKFGARARAYWLAESDAGA